MIAEHSTLVVKELNEETSQRPPTFEQELNKKIEETYLTVSCDPEQAS